MNISLYKMDFPSHPKGWIPLTMEQKRAKEKEKEKEKKPTELINSISKYEKEWEYVRTVTETYGKEIQFRNTLSPIIKKRELNAAK
jgi:hypothetical protein